MQINDEISILWIYTRFNQSVQEYQIYQFYESETLLQNKITKIRLFSNLYKKFYHSLKTVLG